MAEKHFVFLKDNRVMQVAVFASQDEELADTIAQEQGFDDALWIDENPLPAMFSTYNPSTTEFTKPTDEWMIANGKKSAPVEEVDAE